MHARPFWTNRSTNRLTRLFLASFYTVSAALPYTLLFWLVYTNLATPSAQAQSSAPLPPTRQLLEDAKQRLIDRGELTESGLIPEPGALPPPPEEDFESYRLGPGDTLFVNVLRFPDLTFQNTIDLEGNMIVPLAGALSLDGLTVNQARELIRLAFDRFVIDPQVDVILVAQRPVSVTVLGEIVKPGLYPLQAPQLSVALISAGGTTGLADLRTVRVRRTLESGQILEQDVDLFTPLRDGTSIPEVRLADGDTVIVPTLTATDEEYDRNLVARSTVAQPQINVRVLNYGIANRAGTVGNLRLPNGSSFVDALVAAAPDLSNADLRRVALIRFDVQRGRAITQQLDAKEAITGDLSQNPPLENNDVIVIGRNLIARVSYFLNTFTQPFRDILGFLLFFDSLIDSAESLFGPSDSETSN